MGKNIGHSLPYTHAHWSNVEWKNFLKVLCGSTGAEPWFPQLRASYSSYCAMTFQTIWGYIYDLLFPAPHCLHTSYTTLVGCAFVEMVSDFMLFKTLIYLLVNGFVNKRAYASDVKKCMTYCFSVMRVYSSKPMSCWKKINSSTLSRTYTHGMFLVRNVWSNVL